MNTRRPSRPRGKSVSAPAPVYTTRWLLPTEVRNLLGWLASGLILPSELAGTQRRPDALSRLPGWLPLFRDAVPDTALTDACAERGYPVVLQLDVSPLRGSLLAVRSDGSLCECSSATDAPPDLAVLLVPGPLPVAWIRALQFPDSAALDDFRMRLPELPNLAPAPAPAELARVPAALAIAGLAEGWLPTEAPVSRGAPNLSDLNMAAAISALSLALANLGDDLVRVAQAAFDSAPRLPWEEGTPFRSVVDEIFGGGARSQLFWGVVDTIRVAVAQRDEGATPERAVLDFLRAEADKDGPGAARLREFSSEVDGLLGLGANTIREAFQRHSGPVLRALLLFFLRRDPEDLFEQLPGVDLTIADRLAASILFAVRSGWRALSRDYKVFPNLSATISHRLAQCAHASLGTGIDLGTPPARSRPVRELLGTGVGATMAQTAAALELARARKWSQAIETRISLGRGSYRMEIGLGGVQLVLAGDARAVETTVSWESLRQLLAQHAGKLPAEDERRVVAALEDAAR